MVSRYMKTCSRSLLRKMQIKTTMKYHLTYVRMRAKSLSRVWLFATPWTVAYQDSPSMGFSINMYLPGESTGAKSLQSCQTLQPHRRQPTRLPCPWDSPGKNTGVGCHFLLQCMKVQSESEVAQSCPTLSDPMDCSPPGSSIHGIFQARVLEWDAIAFSRGSSWPRDRTQISCIVSRCFTVWATREAPC